MNEKMKSVWLDIESKLGFCCLHKKAAFNEVAGEPIKQLSLVTTATEQMIQSFLGDIKPEKMQNRYIFTYKGVSVELTTYAGVTNVDELFKKAFTHTLTIDSVGFSSSGKVTNMHHGVEDIRAKVLRLTSANVTISESLLRRIMTLMMEGYSLDDSLKQRIDSEKFFEKTGYRKKFFEALLFTVKKDGSTWTQVAKLLGILGPTLEHRKVVVNYTQKLTEDMKDARFQRAFLFLIFAMVKATSKELAPVMQGEKMLGYYDSVCANLQKRVGSLDDYNSLKENYGDDFMDLLFDVQELWMKMENIPYKRPAPSDFDMMAQLLATTRYWNSGVNGSPEEIVVETEEEEAEEAPEEEPSEENFDEEEFAAVDADEGDEEDSFELTGTLNFERTVVGGYSEEDYDEPLEGPVEDDYVFAESKTVSETVTPAVKPAAPPPPPQVERRPVQKKAVCIDDDLPDVKESGGLNEAELAQIEAELENKGKPVATAPAPAPQPKKGDVMTHARGHKSKVLMDGGE